MSEVRSDVTTPHWLDRFLPASALETAQVAIVLRLRLTISVAFAMTAIGSVFVLLDISIGDWWGGALPCFVSVLLSASVPFRIRAGGSADRCTWQMLAGLVLLLTSISINLGGAYAPTIAWLAVFPYFGHALIGRRAGVTIGLLALACVGILLIGSAQGLFPEGPQIDEVPLIMVVVNPLFIGLSLGVVSWASSGIHQAVKHDLEQANAVLSREVEEHERTQHQLETTHQEFKDAAKVAGSAEVVIGILHNLGNVLNAVNVSAGIAEGEVAGIRTEPMTKIADLLATQDRDKESRYIQAFARELGSRRTRLRDEICSLREAVDHAAAIVATQQRHAVHTSVHERVSIQTLLLDAATLSRTSSSKTAEITVVADVPDVFVDRHRLVQIVTNLLSNAQDALCAPPEGTVRVTATLEQDHLQVRVQDNGVGIEACNLERVFAHGYTTKATGHGFGLHACALAANELGGSLRAESEGLGCGTTFILELPVDRVRPGKEQAIAAAS